VKRIAVYCGSSSKVAPVYFEAAKAMGRLLAERGIGVVYGGGHVGLMGAVADAALGAGGQVLGVIPKKLMTLELGHTGCTELFVVDGMHARKAMMSAMSDAFIAMPGGFGTMEELFEAVTWSQLEYHSKPSGLFNVDGYYDPLIAWVNRAANDAFVRPQHRVLICDSDDPVTLLEKLANADLPRIEDWIDDV
jgi:uncharacterized protein (TIGR00730 family)